VGIDRSGSPVGCPNLGHETRRVGGLRSDRSEVLAQGKAGRRIRQLPEGGLGNVEIHAADGREDVPESDTRLAAWGEVLQIISELEQIEWLSTEIQVDLAHLYGKVSKLMEEHGQQKGS
jgi:hypothetical protein